MGSGWWLLGIATVLQFGHPASHRIEYYLLRMLARQVDYDALHAELLNSGLPVDEAAMETYETFVSENYDMSGVFAYRNDEERELKDSLMSKFQVIKNAAAHNDSFVNASFAISSIKKILAIDQLGPWRLLESSSFLNDLLKLLRVEEEDRGDQEDDDDDDEEHRVLQITAVLQMSLFYILEGTSGQRFRNPEAHFVLSEELWTIMIEAMDEDVQCKELFLLYCELLTILLAFPSNVEAFHSCHGDDLLDLAGKIYKNSDEVKQFLSRIQSMI